MIDHAAEAARIIAAHADHRLLEPMSDSVDITLDDAYAIQRLVTEHRIQNGEARVGWKLGYTSSAMRAQMGIASPNFGPLTDAMQIPNGGRALASMTHPRVEPEVALWFGHGVAPGADRGAVLDAVAKAHACLEVVDSVWRDYRFRIEDNTADGSSAAGFVIGEEIPVESIVDVDVRLFVDGIERAAGHGRDAGGHPVDGVVWLVEQLAERGQRLEAGDVVLTGGLTMAMPLVAGGVVSATFDGSAEVAVRS